MIKQNNIKRNSPIHPGYGSESAAPAVVDGYVWCSCVRGEFERDWKREGGGGGSSARKRKEAHDGHAIRARLRSRSASHSRAAMRQYEHQHTLTHQ